MSNLYDNEFYNEMQNRNKKTAQEIMPLLISKLKPKSIVDVGCGRGIFLEEAEKQGIEVLGIDGDYVERDKLLIHNFMGFDLTKRLKIDKKFSLAISFEVAEHIDKAFSDTFIDNLTSLSDIIAFSAAIPMQGGVYHVNEQWPSYWNKKFERRGYRASNCLRDSLWNNDKCAKIRRQNIVLYVKNEQYENITSYFYTEEKLLDIVHPEVYIELQQQLAEVRNYVSILNKERELLIRSSLSLSEIENYLSKEEKDKFYYKIVYKSNNLDFWEMVDILERIKCWRKYSIIFKDNLRCYQLDNFESKINSDSYIVWGAGCDGKKVVELLNILGKKQTIWCDSKEDRKNNVISPEEMYTRYNGEIIIIASRKYWNEIEKEIVLFNSDLKEKIF